MMTRELTVKMKEKAQVEKSNCKSSLLEYMLHDAQDQELSMELIIKCVIKISNFTHYGVFFLVYYDRVI